MGHRRKHAPKRGSLAFLPRGRASSSIGRIRYWPDVEEGPTLLGFMGYKAGVVNVFLIDDEPSSLTFGKEVARAATVIEAPPILVCGIRAYAKDESGLKALSEVWMKDPPKDLGRVLTLPEGFNQEEGLRELEENLTKTVEFRAIAITQPRSTNTPKKKPDVMEIKVGGGALEDQFDYVKGLLGRAVSIEEVFKEGQFVDVIAITKGKGFQGPVKRWGVRILQDKSRKTKRGVAALGPWHPARVMYSVPRAGQMGYHQRTEYNKRILKMGKDGGEMTPKGGFVRYGVVRGPYVLLEGSTPGPKKRLIKLRHPSRPPKRASERPPTITHISLGSQQGK